jgi:hypothetical protein
LGFQLQTFGLILYYLFFNVLCYAMPDKYQTTFMNRVGVFVLLSLFLVSCNSDFGCTSSEIGSNRDVNPDAVFFDYEIWGEEGREDVSINLQYRMGGPNGTTLILDKPSRVLLDGEEIQADSARLTGVYYEVQKPLTAFSGKHTINFYDFNKKEYKEEFEFRPFTIYPNVPESITRGDLVFDLQGLDPVDYIRVVITDTSFESDDINDVDTVKNGRLVILAERLASLKNGPINLQFYKELEKPVKNGTKEGGKLSITYGLGREFEMKDTVKL